MPDHFYTMLQKSFAPYKEEGISCYVFGPNDHKDTTIPVYRFYNSQNGDHYYTTDKSIGDGYQGYAIENNGEPEFRVFECPCNCDTVPLYQWQLGTDHFYTTHSTGELAPLADGRYQGIVGYVYPTKSKAADFGKPLYRYYLSG